MKVKYISHQILQELKELKPDIYNYCKTKFPEIDKWASGEDYPTYNQLVELSKDFKIGFGYFFLEKLPKIKQPKSIYLAGSIVYEYNYHDKAEYWKSILETKFPNTEIKCPHEFVKLKEGTKQEVLADAIIQCFNVMKDCSHVFVIPENDNSFISEFEVNFADYIGLDFVKIYEDD
jgi:hypothetical protein